MKNAMTMTMSTSHKPRSTVSGYTLLELMIVCVIMGSVLTTAASLLAHSRSEGDTTQAYAKDLEEVQRALRWIESDLRGATSCREESRSLVIESGTAGGGVDRSVGPVRYECDGDGRLLRHGADGRTKVAARCVAALDFGMRGRLASVGLQLRARTSTAVPTVVRTKISLRNGVQS